VGFYDTVLNRPFWMKYITGSVAFTIISIVFFPGDQYFAVATQAMCMVFKIRVVDGVQMWNLALWSATGVSFETRI
jgi:hypothetical protein